MEYETVIEARKTAFKNDLEDLNISEQWIVRKHLLHGQPVVFRDDDTYFQLKQEVAENFGVSTTKILMAGSAKLGFSIVPTKLWNSFSIESDVDVVIISDELFDYYWKELYKFNINQPPRGTSQEGTHLKFLKYLLKGWLRPDYFPLVFHGQQKWFDFFNSISYDKYGNYKIRGALYRDEYFFETYHINNIKKLRRLNELYRSS